MKKVLIVLAVLVVIGLMICAIVGCEDKTTPNTSGEPYEVIDNGEGEVTPEDNEEETVPPETDPYVANIPNEIIDFYKEKVEDINVADEDKRLRYDLVFFDDNNTPELVVSDPGYRMILYTYDAGKVIYTQEEYEDEMGWPLGAGGNAGYDYAPRANTIRNYDSDHAGLVRYITYYVLNENSHQLVSLYDEPLYEMFYEDKNNNLDVDEDEFDTYSEEATGYVFGETKISQEDFEAKLVSGDFVELVGTKTFDEMIKALDSLMNLK